MRLISYYSQKGVHLAIECPKGIIDVETTCYLQRKQCFYSIEDVIIQGETAIKNLEEIIENQPLYLLDANKLKYAPCVLNPEKILCVGLNYADHRKECDFETPEHPVLFSKFNNALAAHNESIALNQNAQQYDYEAELAIIIGKTAKNVSQKDALSYVFGYTVANDLSARDFQFRSSQWLIGKSFDKSCPLGPVIVTANGFNTDNLDISCKVNGETRQQANTKDMIFDCAKIVSYASGCMTLKPGDVILTGTPSGVILGMPENQRKWLKKGDRVDVTIENIGTLTNYFE
ncbi:MAG: fumarylacetoacetate hydrolase family protein [Christensenellaceae bacterium]